MTSFPMVSVIIPCFNNEDSIIRALNSVLFQTFKDFEVIIVDDKSTDHTLEYLQSFLGIYSEHPEIKVFINKKNLGPGGSRNFGISKSKGKFLAFLDADDVWLPEKLEKQLPAFDDPNIGASSTLGLQENNSIDLKGFCYSGNIFDRIIDNSGPTFHTDSFMVRSDLMKSVGGFYDKIRIGEDRITWLKIAAITQFRCIEIPLYISMKNKDSITQNIPLHIECDKFVHRYILDLYKNRLTRKQVKRINRNYHILTSYNYRHLGLYWKAAYHSLKAWFYGRDLESFKIMTYNCLLCSKIKTLIG